MKDDDSIVFAVLGIVGLFIFYKISQTNASLTAAQLAANAKAQSNPWLTVPGALSTGLTGIASLTKSFSNLFTSNSGYYNSGSSSSSNSGYYSGSGY